MTTAELAFKSESTLGEGAIWDWQNNRLLWIDIMNGEIHSFSPVSGTDRLIFKTEQTIGTVVQRQGGGLAVAVRHGFAFVDEETGAITPVCNSEGDKPQNRFNDGKCDAAGRFWAGTMSREHMDQAVGSLYCLDVDLTCRKMQTGIRISNGICWSGDNRTMYYTDTATGVIWAYDYDIDTGSIANRRTCVEIPKGEGGPDGFTMDEEGMLWVAQWGGWQVGRYDPRTGRKLCRVDVPAAQASSCAFGGDGLDELYITTARENLTENALAEQKLAGSLFVANVGVKGVRANRFKG